MFVDKNITINPVMYMSLFQNTVLTKIHTPCTVFSEKGRNDGTTNRRFFGLSFCIGGQITYHQNGKSYVSHHQNAILLPKYATYTLDGDKEGLFPVINFECTGLDVAEITVLPLKDPAQYIKDFHALSNAFLHDNQKLRQFQLLYSILEKLDSEQASNPLSPILSYINTHLSDSTLSNDLLAEKMGISEVYLRKLFASHLGVTPKQYILDLRIKTARQLLTGTTKTVTEISEACGFASVYHFSRIFKQRTALTPTEYATQHRVLNI